MWPFGPSRTKWLRGLLYAEQVIKEAGELGRRELDSDLDASSFGQRDDFDRGVLDYLGHAEHCAQVQALLRPVNNTLEDVRAWMLQTRDELLYPVANADIGVYSATADCLGQHLPGLLEQLDSLILGTKR